MNLSTLSFMFLNVSYIYVCVCKAFNWEMIESLHLGKYYGK